MRVVPPHDRTGLARAWAALRVGEPVIGKALVRLDRAARPAERQIVGAFVGLVVAQPMRVHAARIAGSVKKFDNNLVADFGANNRTEDAQPFRLRLADREAGIGVLDEAGL